jgi:hypothetical protein
MRQQLAEQEAAARQLRTAKEEAEAAAAQLAGAKEAAEAAAEAVKSQLAAAQARVSYSLKSKRLKALSARVRDQAKFYPLGCLDVVLRVWVSAGGGGGCTG